MALDKEKTQISLFGNLRKTDLQVEEKPSLPQKISIQIDDDTPKWQTLEKVTLLISLEDKMALDALTKRIMKHRASVIKSKAELERITTNTIIRALIANFIDEHHKLSMDVMTSEEDVIEWIGRLFGKDKSGLLS